MGFPPLTVDGWPAALVAQYLSAEHGIGVRDGRFCAHPLLARINPAGTAVRASLGLSSRADDVDRLITALTALADHGPAWTYAGAEQDYVAVASSVTRGIRPSAAARDRFIVAPRS